MYKQLSVYFFTFFLLIGCSSDKPLENIQAKLQVGKTLKAFQLPDQHTKLQKIPSDTKFVIFSFSKPVGHMCNELLNTKEATYLPKHKAVYVADVSPAPTIIKNMFILPDLEKLPFPILLINDDLLSASYSKKMDKESIVVLSLDNLTIIKIQNLKDEKELERLLEQ